MKKNARLDPSFHRCVVGVVLWMALLVSVPATGQPRVDENVVYGMVSGTALLMDVHHPERPNGQGIITLYGNAWSGPDSYDGWQLKRLGAPEAIVDAGFTSFVVNHRLAPQFRYPAAVEDVQRAVRFVRFHAHRFGIDPERIGAFGASSGGHLAALLGTLDGDGDPNDPDPVNRVSAKVQAVAANASAVDFTHPEYRGHWGPVNFLGLPPLGQFMAAFREASPVTHVSSDDAAFYFVHGDKDDIVPLETIEGMVDALSNVGVPVEIQILPETGHGFAPRYVESARWLIRHLVGEDAVAGVEPVLERHEQIVQALRGAREGSVQEALDTFTRVGAGVSLSIDFLQWAVLCKYGSLDGFAKAVLEACDNAVAGAPDDPFVMAILRETRAVARALAGDGDGAIDDLEAYLPYSPGPVRERRSAWIETLRTGDNPFDQTVLDQLRAAGGF